METVSRDGVTLAYERAGPADAETVVLVEGLGYGRWMWHWQRDALEADYDVVVPDNRGTGDSDAPDGPYSVAEMAADLDAVLADADVDEAHVVGASMGGMIAQQYALDFDRAESLTLLCTSPGGEIAAPTPPETQQRMFEVPEGLDEREEIRYKMEPAATDRLLGDDDLMDQIVDWRLESDAPQHARGAQGAAVAAFDASDRLDEIDVPTLVMHGTADRVLPAENSRVLDEHLPDSDLELVEGGPHLFFVEDAARVNDSLLSFLDG
ncbi:alpha/beta fold hydrolase [Halobacterium wangiae]|uniref:alpha/beta fold hydrolase n=1 Tax=Halobacterium wangiae TaxID=2902623 RepID=UPI001E3B14E2|nr:alpha/beta hydrolase [Halobacterium wangiae]